MSNFPCGMEEDVSATRSTFWLCWHCLASCVTCIVTKPFSAIFVSYCQFSVQETAQSQQECLNCPTKKQLQPYLCWPVSALSDKRLSFILHSPVKVVSCQISYLVRGLNTALYDLRPMRSWKVTSPLFRAAARAFTCREESGRALLTSTTEAWSFLQRHTQIIVKHSSSTSFLSNSLAWSLESTIANYAHRAGSVVWSRYLSFTSGCEIGIKQPQSLFRSLILPGAGCCYWGPSKLPYSCLDCIWYCLTCIEGCISVMALQERDTFWNNAHFFLFCDASLCFLVTSWCDRWNGIINFKRPYSPIDLALQSCFLMHFKHIIGRSVINKSA